MNKQIKIVSTLLSVMLLVAMLSNVSMALSAGTIVGSLSGTGTVAK